MDKTQERNKNGRFSKLVGRKSKHQKDETYEILIETSVDIPHIVPEATLDFNSNQLQKLGGRQGQQTC